MERLVQCYVEPKPGLLTGEESSLDILLGGKIGHDIQGRILSFLDCEPGFPDEESDSYVECYDDLMNPHILPVEPDERSCFENIEFDDDFVIGQELWAKDGDDEFMEELFQYNVYTRW
jgi:hypothetical protein